MNYVIQSYGGIFAEMYLSLLLYVKQMVCLRKDNLFLLDCMALEKHISVWTDLGGKNPYYCRIRGYWQ